MMDVTLRPYQTDAVQFLATQHKGLVRARTGAGKTIIGLSALDAAPHQRAIIVCPRSAQLKWANDMVETGFTTENCITVVDKQTAAQRLELYLNPTPASKYLIVRYGQMLNDVDTLIKKECLIDGAVFDESHKMRNYQTKTFKAAKKLVRTFKVNRKIPVIFLTATDQSRGPQNLWTTLHMLNPGAWPSYWKFVGKYCVVREGYNGSTEIRGVKKDTIKELRTRLRKYAYYIKDTHTKGYVPEVVKQKLFCKQDKSTMKMYRQLEKEMIVDLPDDDLLVSSTSLTTQLRLRQLLVCPKLIHEGLPYGAGIDMIGEHAWDNEDAHIVLFCPFPSAFTYLEERLRTKWKFKHFYTLRGGMPAKDVGVQVDQWSRHSMDREKTGSVLFCSTKFAESFDLFTALNGYHLGFDWNFEVNEQADGRMARGEKAFANSHYVVSKETVDTYMLEVLNNKKRVSTATFKDYMNL